MEQSDRYSEITAWLRDSGRNEREISKILERIQKFEAETNVDSIMDSIANGTFNIAAVIREITAELEESP